MYLSIRISSFILGAVLLFIPHLWISIIQFLDIHNSIFWISIIQFLDILKSAEYWISIIRFLDILKSNYGYPKIHMI